MKPFTKDQNSVSPQGESNSRPLVYKTSALTAELWRRCGRSLETVGLQWDLLAVSQHREESSPYEIDQNIHGPFTGYIDKRILAFNKMYTNTFFEEEHCKLLFIVRSNSISSF